MKRIITLWALLGAAYVALMGGLCGVLVGALNQSPRFYKAPVIVQAIAGAALVLAVEFRCALNLWLRLGIWDYSRLPGNVLGQICPAYGLLWFFIMPLAIWAKDTARFMIWDYECIVYGWTEKPPELSISTMPLLVGAARRSCALTRARRTASENGFVI